MRHKPCLPAARAPRRLGASRRRARVVGVFCGCLAAVAFPGSALADSMSLAISPAPVVDLTSLITWTASSEDGTLAVIAVNNPSVPCAANPRADQGQTITPGHIFDPGNLGTFSGSTNYTPPSTGAYTVCGWLEIPVGLVETDGGPVTAAASLPIQVRAPHVSLALSFPRHPEPGRTFTLHLIATSEVKRDVVVEGIPFTRRGCPVNYAAEEEANHLIDQTVTGGPWRLTTNVLPLHAGNYIFCAWADPPEDEGLDPEATARLVLRLGQPAHKKRRPTGRAGSHR